MAKEREREGRVDKRRPGPYHLAKLSGVELGLARPGFIWFGLAWLVLAMLGCVWLGLSWADLS